MKKTIITLSMILGLVLCAGIVLAQAATQSPIRSTNPRSTADTELVFVELSNQDPNPAYAGDTVVLNLRIENTGGLKVDDVKVELLEDYPFAVVDGSAVQDLGPLYPYQTDRNYIYFRYKLLVDKDAPSGDRSVRIRYSYDGDNWFVMPVTVKIFNKDFAQIIYVDKARLMPGVETDMRFTINNLGNAPLKNLIFSWEQADNAVLPVYSDDTKYIKYLDVGKSIELDYKVVADVNANPGLYPLSLKLQFESLTNSTLSTIETTAGVFIGGTTDFDVSFSESTQGQISLSVANTGNNPAQSVMVSVPQQEGFTVSGSSSAIIGNLDKGDYTIVSFGITQRNNTIATATQQGTRNFNATRYTNTQNATARTQMPRNGNLLTVDIDYTDTTGERHTVEKQIPIQQLRSSQGLGRTITTQSSFFSSNLFYAIVLIVVVGVGFWIYKRKKQEKIRAAEKTRIAEKAR